MWSLLIAGVRGYFFVCLRGQDKTDVFSREFLLWHTFKIITFFRKLLLTALSFKRVKKKNAYCSYHHLTKFKMCISPVVVKFGLQFFLVAVHFNSFGVKMNSIGEIAFLEGLITLLPINISYGCKENKKNNLFQSLWL